MIRQIYPGADRAVFNENDAFTILVLSTTKRYSSFLKKVSVFQKICFKVLKTFKVSTDFHIKTCLLSNGGLFWKSLVPFFRRTCTLSVGFKKNLYKKAFSCVKIKTNPDFAVKLAEWSNHSFLLSIHIQMNVNCIFQSSALFNMW